VPPKKHTLRNVAIVVLVLIIVIVIAAAAYSAMSSSSATKEHITKAEVSGPPGWASCPTYVDSGSNFVCQVHINNTGSASLNVTGFDVTSSADIYGDEFTYVSSSPALPFEVPAGQTASVSVTVTAPSSVPSDSSLYVTVINFVVQTTT
jgi:uncharacterized membrane protein